MQPAKRVPAAADGGPKPGPHQHQQQHQQQQQQQQRPRTLHRNRTSDTVGSVTSGHSTATAGYARTPRTSRTPRSDAGAAAMERQPLLGRRAFNHEFEPGPVYSCVTNPHTHLPVYTNIHRIRRDIVSVVEDYLSPEQLHDMRINVSVVRPLVDKLYELDDISIVYCLLVNRAQFLHEQAHLNNRQNVNFTRAALCELVAHRILRRFNEDNEGLEGLLVLSHILVAGFEPFQNAPASVRPYDDDADNDNNDHDGDHEGAGAGIGDDWLYRKTLPALEVAILSEAKFFLSSTACQKVIEAIYVGRVTYTPSSLLDIIPDRYKQKPIALYDPRRASLLNQYRLVVPRTRNILEAVQFVVLLALYLCFMARRADGGNRDDRATDTHLGALELAFSVFSFGWVLDQFATILEHGWRVYTQNLWSFLDVAYAVVYWVYLVLRVHGWRVADPSYGRLALDVLALAAPVLVPRLAFTLLSDNLLFVSLRSMMADFTLLTFLAAWCFAGFLLSLAWLGEGQFPLVVIGKWMVYIWFGLDGTGIHRSTEFHWLLGPALMVAFAFLGNTLFLTVLVSMLSNTFSTIVSNATAEIQYRRAVLTLEGVKSDAIFAYQPPFNILALFVLVPLKFLVSPRWFHKIHVACVRSINLPVLLLIAVVERRLLWPASPYSQYYYRASSYGPRNDDDDDDDDDGRLPHTTSDGPRRRVRRSFWDKWRITAHSDIQAVFEVPPPDSVENEIAADDDLTHHLIRRQFVTRQQQTAEPATATKAAAAQAAQEAPQAPQEPTPRRQSTSVVKFADENTAAPSDGARTPRPPPTLKRGASRRDSIAFPGLDPDKLRMLLQAEAGDGSGGGGGGGDGDDDDNNDNNGNDVHSRLDSLEASMQRIEGMLVQLLGSAAGRQGGLASLYDNDDNHGGGGEKQDENENFIETAHTVEDEVVDEDDALNAEHTGTMSDLDLTADER
ncbi:receptor-activated Ca2+-permeable cation channel [Niveomyces insectorum RCEF 264]|uniref:Receptor-activated Ca2+-permeable cation channel n=1 Tax=Niveomyces insectorum RCEF 264 TaxID=1081102 RepID=A0A167PFJ0_9HYPO|nr:receptor-activated Ca2+-permeable cation channel [Niveomyces insectorum RCEF 264]